MRMRGRENARVSGGNGPTKDSREDVHYLGSRERETHDSNDRHAWLLPFWLSSKQTDRMKSLQDLYICEKIPFSNRDRHGFFFFCRLHYGRLQLMAQAFLHVDRISHVFVNNTVFFTAV